MKFLPKILITFVSAILTAFAIYSGYTIYAASDTSSFVFVKALYHNEMNNFFNEKTSSLVTILDDNETAFYGNEQFKAPEDGEDCVEGNVSTYCVAVEALNLYLGYVSQLNSMKGSLEEFISGGSLEGNDVNFILALWASRNAQIDNEIIEAKMVMEATIAAYNEFRLAYPMHKEYENIINSLVKYKLGLQSIKRQVREFPLRFIDATSQQCE